LTVKLRWVAGRLSVASVASAGALSPGDAERIVRSSAPRALAAERAAVPPGLEGLITFSVRPDGTVDQVEISGRRP